HNDTVPLPAGNTIILPHQTPGRHPKRSLHTRSPYSTVRSRLRRCVGSVKRGKEKKSHTRKDMPTRPPPSPIVTIKSLHSTNCSSTCTCTVASPTAPRALGTFGRFSPTRPVETSTRALFN
ncbi:unnamed protein product, partial [Tuber aestivum]